MDHQAESHLHHPRLLRPLETQASPQSLADGAAPRWAEGDRKEASAQVDLLQARPAHP